jgi:hypothetical protein
MPRRVEEAMPVALVPLVMFVTFLVIDGLQLGLLAATLSFFVLGPAYLIHLKRHAGEPKPKDNVAKARHTQRSFRAVVAYNAAVCVGSLVLVVVRPAELEGRAWTVGLVLFAGLILSSTLYIWSVASPRATARARHRALAVGGLVDVAVCSSAVIAATGNHLDHWLGGTAWTLGLAALSALSALSALNCFRRLRVSVDAER